MNDAYGYFKPDYVTQAEIPIFSAYLLVSASFLACLDSDWGIRGYGVIGHGDAKIPLGAAFRSFVSGAPSVTPPNPSASNTVQMSRAFHSQISDSYCCFEMVCNCMSKASFLASLLHCNLKSEARRSN